MPRLATVFLALLVAGCGSRPPQPVPQPPQDFSARLLSLHNAARRTPLSVHPALASSAQQWADSMSRRNRLEHGDWLNRIHAAGYQGIVSENVAAGQRSADEVFGDWMADPPHRSNVLDPRWKSVGFGHARSAAGVEYWVADYGGWP